MQQQSLETIHGEDLVQDRSTALACVNTVLRFHRMPTASTAEWAGVVGDAQFVDPVDATRRLFMLRKWVA